MAKITQHEEAEGDLKKHSEPGALARIGVSMLAAEKLAQAFSLGNFVRQASPGIANAVRASDEQSTRRRVYVSVYILVGDSTSDALLLSLTGGGLYHSGIEIEGVEYAFGGGPNIGSGIWRQAPRRAGVIGSFKNASYKESLYMGMTWPLTPAGLRRVIFDMELEWRQNQYNSLSRNWCVARSASQPPRKGPARRSHTPLA